jgi:hypothetical protein
LLFSHGRQHFWHAPQHLHVTTLIGQLTARPHTVTADLAVMLSHRSDDQLFGTARKIITALINRIHTVEWTTAIVQHPAGRAGQVGTPTLLYASLLGAHMLSNH